ncbi:MAG: glycerol-3-phosphate acyltransferase [Chloroflexi bacterium]|nr:glycerol-3-phosphate acyltransferase [Chloroflexota bacterium]
MLPSDTIQALLLVTVISYFLGAFPSAAIVGRLRGVDVFSVGTGSAGAANVFRQVGPTEGFIVLLVDAAKGALAIGLSYRLGLTGEGVLLPALAAVAGHWRSVFTRFKGGDGVSTLVGITLAVFPVYGLASVIAAVAVGTVALLLNKPVPTMWGGIAGYGFLLLRLPVSNENTVVVFGIVSLALMVFAHGYIGHRRRAV